MRTSFLGEGTPTTFRTWGVNRSYVRCPWLSIGKGPKAARKRKTLHPFDVTNSHYDNPGAPQLPSNSRVGGEVRSDPIQSELRFEVWPLRCGCRGAGTSQGGPDTCVASRKRKRSASGQGCSSPFRFLSGLVTGTTRIPWSLPRLSTSLRGVLWSLFAVLCPNRAWFPWRFRVLRLGLRAA
jgi:hypothetical protein